MTEPRFGQVWVWRNLPHIQWMYIGGPVLWIGAARHAMLNLTPGGSYPCITYWHTVGQMASAWTLVEDVDADQEG